MSEAEQTGNARQDNTARLLAGRYRLGGVLGRGGMGTVWRALDETLGRPVAVKELRFPSNIDQEEKRRLVTRTLREAKAIARIRNTSAVTVYDVVHEDDRPWIVMELVEGKSLAEVIREDGLLTPKRAAEVGLAVLDVLRSAHREGILHRDVKPSNVLIADDGRVVLTDFGIAQVEGDPSITSTGMLVGAPSYISPERARGHKPGPAADLWSLGGLLYASVEGFPPYDKGSAIATLTAVMTEPLEPPKNAGPLEKVIYGLLAKDPEQRLDDAGARALLNDLIHAPEPEPVDATKVVPLPPVPEKRPRRGGSKAGGSKAGGTSGGGSASAAAGASAGAASGAASSGGAAAAAGRKAEDAADRLRGALRSLRPARKTAAGSSAASASASASAAAPADGTRGTTADAEGTPGRSATGAAGSPGTGTGADSVSGSGAASGNGADAEAPGTGGSARSAGTGARGGGAEVAEPEAAHTTASGATASGATALESDASRTNASAGTASKEAADDAGSGATRAAGAVDAAGAATSGTSGAQGDAGANATAAHSASGLPATPPPPDTPPHPQPKASLTDVVSRRVLVAVAVVVALAVLGTVLALSLSGGDGAQDSSNGSDKAASSGASADSGEAGKGSGGDAGTDKGSGGDTGSSEDSGSGESAGQGKDLGENSSSGSGNDAGTGSRYGAVTTYKHDQGFSIGLPKGWKYVSSDAAGARFTGPDGQKLLVGWTTTPKDDAVRDWENQERYMTRAQYDRIRIEKVGYRGWNAADWEFTYVDGGTKWRSIDRGFVVNSRLGYALMYTAKAADWSSEQRRGTWQTFARTFTPKS
ncbi:protein kinase domain-containing protein [Streptomyces himalayensis]|nr:protein kinase [Streptomyces himalayensis]